MKDRMKEDYKVNCRDLFQYLISQNYAYITNLFPNIGLSIFKYIIPKIKLKVHDQNNTLDINANNLFLKPDCIKTSFAFKLLMDIDEIDISTRVFKECIAYSTIKPFLVLFRIPDEGSYENSIARYVNEIKEFFSKGNNTLVNNIDGTTYDGVKYDLEYYEEEFAVMKLTNINFVTKFY